MNPRSEQKSIEWQPEFSVHIDEFDEQHRVLFSAINDILLTLDSSGGRQVMSDVLERLLRFTEEHFSNEEAFLRENGYPEVERHIREHGVFVKKIKDYRRLFESGEMDISLAVLEILVRWLTDHILGSDRRYTRYFQEKGILS